MQLVKITAWQNEIVGKARGIKKLVELVAWQNVIDKASDMAE